MLNDNHDDLDRDELLRFYLGQLVSLLARSVDDAKHLRVEVVPGTWGIGRHWIVATDLRSGDQDTICRRWGLRRARRHAAEIALGRGWWVGVPSPFIPTGAGS